MTDKENKRQCFKCGCSPAKDHVTLYRFPKPGIRNLTRCELWAKYICPEGQYSSIQFQKKLHDEHRMLCDKHFKATDYADVLRKHLFRHAVPSDAVNLQVPQFPAMEQQAGPSRTFVDLTNVPNLSTTSTSHSAMHTKPLHNDDTIITTVISPSLTHPTVMHSENDTTKKTERENKLLNNCIKYMRRTCQLRNRIKNLKKKAILKILSEDDAVKMLSKKLTPSFALLLQSQIKNYKKKVTGRRWNRKEKIIALRLFKRSPTCYRLLRRLFILPAPNTLKALLSKVPFKVGINKAVTQVLSQYTKTQKPEENEYVIMFDEMSIKKHLNYNRKEDLVEGFQDHALQGRTSNIASYALVFMIAGIRKKVKEPIAHYFSSSYSTADRLAVFIKEVLHECFLSGVNIAAVVCDMDGVNRRALSILGASVEHPYITIETVLSSNENVSVDIIAIFDTPHLLKCFRNLFLKYDIECPTNITSENKTGRGVAKWSHIQQFYEADNSNPNFVFAPVLKKDHLAPNSKQKMKVKLAAQVLSHSVAAGMYAKISQGELTADAVVTANVVSSMDKLFDAVNSDSPDLRRGKPNATNMRQNTPHLQLFAEMKNFFQSMKFIGSPRKPPSQEGWIWTINGLIRLWNHIKKKHKSLATRRIQQDPLENLFGCIRGNCGANTNPTTAQFEAGLKTSVLSNLSRIGTTGNCERDNNVVIDNFNTLLSVKTTDNNDIPRTNPGQEIAGFSLPDVNEEVISRGEMQACAYVCGFLFKKLPWNCRICKNAYTTKNIETEHIFVQCKEYNDKQQSLHYVDKNVILCVESCASAINTFLEKNSHVEKLKIKCLISVKGQVNFDIFNKCQEHKAAFIDFITNNLFAIMIKRFCILKNRSFAEESSAAALKRKMDIILHK